MSLEIPNFAQSIGGSTIVNLRPKADAIVMPGSKALDTTTEGGWQEKAYITGRRRTRGTPAAGEVIKLLDDNDWNVSLFADFF